MDGRITINIEHIIEASTTTSTALSKKYKASLADSENNLREPELRPSSFPLCSILVLNDMILHKMGKGKTWECTGDVYTSIGTALHETVQKWMPRQGSAFGDWVCHPCKKIRRATTNRTCKCGKEMEYREIEVEYRGVKGHIDMILEDDGVYSVNDFKTTSMKKVEAVKQARNNTDREEALQRIVSKQYVLQLLSYTYICEELFDWDIKGASLLFIARDDPKSYLEVNFPWTDERRKEISTFLESQIVGFNAAKESLKNKNAKQAVVSRACKNSNHYRRCVEPFYFGGCPMKSICVPMESLKPVLTHLNRMLAKI